jgi:hypothetical protein
VKYLSLLLRGIAFWLAAFYAFTLGWGTLSLNVFPDSVAIPALLAPLAGLTLGSLLPDRAIGSSSAARVLHMAVLSVGIIGALLVAVDSLQFSQGANWSGFWFQISVSVISAFLFLRIGLARRLIAQ